MLLSVLMCVLAKSEINKYRFVQKSYSTSMLLRNFKLGYKARKT